MCFKEAFEETVGLEGGYSNNAADSGGETMYGITIQVARANGYMGEMKLLPLSTAQHIYRRQYWEVLKLDEISVMSPNLAKKLFDIGVNCGVGSAGQWLQRSLNIFNQQQKDYPDLKVDGVLGPVSVMTLRSLMNRRQKVGEQIVFKALNALQGHHYITLAEKREKDETFTVGWFANRVD